jgi:WD40 repeat protein
MKTTNGNLAVALIALSFASSQGCAPNLAPTIRQPIRLDAPPATRLTFVAFSPDGKTLAYGLLNDPPYDPTGPRPLKQGEGDVLFLCDPATGKEIRRLRQDEDTYPKDGFFSPDGKRLAVGFWGTKVVVLDPSNGRTVCTLAGTRWDGQGLDWSPDGALIAGKAISPGADPVVDNDIHVWDGVSGRDLRRFGTDGPSGSPTKFAFSSDGRIMAVEHLRVQRLDNSIDGKGWRGRFQIAVDLWEVASGKRLGQVGDAARPVEGETCPTGRHLDKVGAQDAGFRVRDLAGGHYLLLPSYDRTPPPFALPHNGPLILFDAATGEESRCFEEVKNVEDLSIALSPNGATLAAAGSDGGANPKSVVMIWDVSDLVRACRRPAEYSDDELAALWPDLADDDASKAFRAMRTLAAVPVHGAPILAGRLRPVDAAAAPRLAADLEAEDPDTRLKASLALTRLGEAARPALEKARGLTNSDEARRQIDDLLKGIDGPPSADDVRNIRAIDVLERIASDKARDALKAVADGAAGAPITQAATDALDRLAKSSSKP